MTVAGLRRVLKGLNPETPILVVVDGVHYDLLGQAEVGLNSGGRIDLVRLFSGAPSTQPYLLLRRWETSV